MVKSYQIKGNHEFKNMVTNILHADHRTPPPPHGPREWGQKIKKIRIWSCDISNERESLMQQLDSKLIFCPQYPHPTRGVKMSKFNFFRARSCCITHLMEWSIEHHAITYFLLTHTLNLWIGLNLRNI